MDVLDNNDTITHESDVPFFPTALRWGLISGGVSIVYALISNLLGIATSQVMLSTIIGLTIVGVIAYMAIKSHREDLGGFITFGRAFLVAFVALLISGVISTIFNFIYMNYIDPSVMDNILEMTESMYNNLGMDEDVIETALEEARKGMQSPMSMISGLIGVSVFSAIIAAIVGAIMKKVRPASF